MHAYKIGVGSSAISSSARRLLDSNMFRERDASADRAGGGITVPVEHPPPLPRPGSVSSGLFVFLVFIGCVHFVSL